MSFRRHILIPVFCLLMSQYLQGVVSNPVMALARNHEFNNIMEHHHGHDRQGEKNRLAIMGDKLNDDNKRIRRYPPGPGVDPLLNHEGANAWMPSGECPLSADGTREYYCPYPTSSGAWVCIDDYQLCNGVRDCPGDIPYDEDPLSCLFHNVAQTQISLLTKGVNSILSSIVSTQSEPEYSDYYQRHRRSSNGNIPSNQSK